MKRRALMLVIVALITVRPACAQSADTNVAKASVCDIVNHPSQFIGKTVEVRAQIWPDNRYPNFFWMNESTLQLGKVCRFLLSSFKGGTNLAGQAAFGTFQGRIVKRISRQKSTLLPIAPKGLPVIFIVDQQSDIHLRRDYLSGPIPMLQLYDEQTASFVRPE